MTTLLLILFSSQTFLFTDYFSLLFLLCYFLLVFYYNNIDISCFLVHIPGNKTWAASWLSDILKECSQKEMSEGCWMRQGGKKLGNEGCGSPGGILSRTNTLELIWPRGVGHYLWLQFVGWKYPPEGGCFCCCFLASLSEGSPCELVAAHTDNS